MYAQNDGRIGIGTTTPNTALHVVGTITATTFVGDGSQIVNVPTTGGLTGGNITIADTGGTIYAGSTTVSTFTATGSITAAGGGYVVDTSGSMTAIAIASTGTITVGGALVRSGSIMIGSNSNTHVNLGVTSTTGTTTGDYSYATVGGGKDNKASRAYSTVGGGYNNTTSGNYATVGGGFNNTAGSYDTV